MNARWEGFKIPKLTKTKYGMMDYMGFIETRRSFMLDVDEEYLIKEGEENLNTIVKVPACPKCYDNTTFPEGTTVKQAYNTCRNIRKYYYRVVNKTVHEYFKCDKCDYKIHKITTYKKQMDNRPPLKYVKETIRSRIKNILTSFKNGEYKYTSDTYQAGMVAQIDAYQDILGLLGDKALLKNKLDWW
ncbi:MAG: hypothetical protein ACFFAO_02115 [Candidatus Hermodarchaeota archaeon]